MVKPTKTRSRKFNDLLQFSVVVVVLIVLNLIAAQFTARLDLTEDNRYSISPATKKILSELKDVVYIEVYLEGDFPSGFRRLQKSTREMLEEFRRYAGNNLEYRFVDPSASTDVNTRNQFYQQLAKKVAIQSLSLSGRVV
ncbi:MAG: hypothetical protein EOP04_22670 [Proteobacteria bacterium]|nr:MAG: hypothetical protein EOP04_22670 [Pseudomonadota bacterium]